MKKIVVIGLGLHARHHHYPILEGFAEKLDVSVELVIDLADQQNTIQEYLASCSLKPKKLMFLSPMYRTSEELPPEARQCLNALLAETGIDGVLISTEPKSHKAYALWAIQNNVDVLMDKPISAPIMDRQCSEDAQKVFQDYIELEEALRISKSRVVVMAPRRHHRGINAIRDYLNKFIKEFKVPITFLTIYHAEGMWNMPDEFFVRENHPYKYGYGQLLHSGYHHIDLFYWLLKLNFQLPQRPDRVEFLARHVTPFDFARQVDNSVYKNLFNSDGTYDPYFTSEKLDELKNFGETDVVVLCQAFCGEAVITTASINLLQTSYCRRAWSALPANTYKKNGRTRHESINIQVGPLLNIQAQWSGVHGQAQNVFRIMIFRNSALVGGEEYEQIDIPDQREGGLLMEARMEIIERWLSGQSTNTDLADHCITDQAISRLYSYMFKQNLGLQSSEAIPLIAPVLE